MISWSRPAIRTHTLCCWPATGTHTYNTVNFVRGRRGTGHGCRAELPHQIGPGCTYTLRSTQQGGTHLGLLHRGRAEVHAPPHLPGSGIKGPHAVLRRGLERPLARLADLGQTTRHSDRPLPRDIVATKIFQDRLEIFMKAAGLNSTPFRPDGAGAEAMWITMKIAMRAAATAI